MSIRNKLSLDLTSDPAELPEVRKAVRAWSKRHGWDEQDTADIVLAIDEALSNVIRHGYDNEIGHKIICELRPLCDQIKGEGLEIRIRDYGKQVPLKAICGRDLDDIRPGGLGVHIIRSVMCSAEYSHAEGGGMLLILRKYKQPDSKNNHARDKKHE